MALGTYLGSPRSKDLFGKDEVMKPEGKDTYLLKAMLYLLLYLGNKMDSSFASGMKDVFFVSNSTVPRQIPRNVFTAQDIP